MSLLIHVAFVLCLFSGAASWGANHRASVCGYEVSEHAPESVIGRLATAAYDTGDPNIGFFFPTIASLSLRQKDGKGPSQELLLNVNDGTIRTGAVRFSNAQVWFLNSDANELGTVQDVAVIGAHMQMLIGMHLNPFIAINDGQGRIQILVSNHTGLAAQIAVVHRGRDTAEYVSLVLPEMNGHPFRSVDMVETSPGVVRVFGLTDTSLYYLDLKLNEPGVVINLPEWEKFADRVGGRFVRALSSELVVIADEIGKIDFFRGQSKTSLGIVPGGWLTSLSAFQTGKGDFRIATLSYSQTQNATPSIHLWHGGQFSKVNINFPEGEKPVAVAYAGMKANNLEKWLRVRNREEIRTGLLTEVIEGELRRLIVMTRNGMNYEFRGVSGLDTESPKLSNPRWYYVGPNYTKLETYMAQAGFDVEALRGLISMDYDVGEFGEKLRTRLVDGYGFESLDGKAPQNYKGDATKILGAWHRRLNALRDLRLARTQVSSIIAGLGITDRRDQILVYELMDFEDWEDVDGGPDLEDQVSLSDREWLARFRTRVEEQNLVLNVATHEHFSSLKDYFDANLKDRKYSAVDRQAVDELPAPAKVLYLISRHYVGKPFKHQVEDFLNFCQLSGADQSSDSELFWQTLTEYLDSVDPLRRVVDDESLVRFLTVDPS